MRLYKAIKPVVVALGGDVSKIAGKPLSKIATYLAPYVTDFVNKNSKFVATYDFATDPSNPTCDKTYDEIIEAIESGNEVKFMYSGLPLGALRSFDVTEGGLYHSGAFFDDDSLKLTLYSFLHLADDTVTFNNSIYFTPDN